MTETKTFSQVISEKEREIETKFEDYKQGMSKIFSERMMRNINFFEKNEGEMQKEIAHMIGIVQSTIEQHRRDIDRIQDARHVY